jgi:hypothetical protein
LLCLCEREKENKIKNKEEEERVSGFIFLFFHTKSITFLVSAGVCVGGEMNSAASPETLAECLRRSAAGGGSGGEGEGQGSGGDDADLGVAAAEVAAWLVERADESSSPSSSSSSSASSLASLLDELSSCLRSGGRRARVLDAGVFDWAPKLLGVADGVEKAREEEKDEEKKEQIDAVVDRDQMPSSSSLLSAAVHRLARALAEQLSPREALALFSAEMSSPIGGRER